MKIIKLGFPLPKILQIGDVQYGIHSFFVAPAPETPAEFVLAAGRQSGHSRFEGGIFQREIDLSNFYRTQQVFDEDLEKGFPVTDAFFEDSDANHIYTALSEQGLAMVTDQTR